MAKSQVIQDLNRLFNDIKKSMNISDIGVYKLQGSEKTNSNLLVDGNTEFGKVQVVGVKLISHDNMFFDKFIGMQHIGNIALPEIIEVYYNLNEKSQLDELKEKFDNFLGDYSSEFKDPNKIVLMLSLNLRVTIV